MEACKEGRIDPPPFIILFLFWIENNLYTQEQLKNSLIKKKNHAQQPNLINILIQWKQKDKRS